MVDLGTIMAGFGSSGSRGSPSSQSYHCPYYIGVDTGVCMESIFTGYSGYSGYLDHRSIGLARPPLLLDK